MKNSRTILSRLSAKTIGLAILLIAILSLPAGSHTRRFPEINLIRGKTSAGHSYLSGGVSFAEQRLMEGAADSYNLRLMFTSRLGTPVTPAFVLIGANDRRNIERVSLGAPWFYIQLPPGGYTILTRFKRDVVLLRDVHMTKHRVRKYFLRGD